jgi:hypothetical protein
MIRTFSQYQSWEDAVRSDGHAVDLLPSHSYPHPHDASDPVVAFVKADSKDLPDHGGAEIGFWDQEGGIGYLASNLDEWALFEYEGIGLDGDCDVCGGNCGEGHALAF